MSAVHSSPTPSVKPTVVLACASDDAVAMTKVLRRLVERGVRVDVVAGVDFDMRPFQDALARGTTRTVYVICRSDDLDAFQVDRLRTAAQNAKVSSDRLVLVPFDPELPIDFAETVLRQLAEDGRMVRVTRELPPVPAVGPRHSTSAELSLVATGPSLRRATALLGAPPEAKPVETKPIEAKPVVTTPLARIPVVKALVAKPAVVAAPPIDPSPTKPLPTRVIAAPVVGAPSLAAPRVTSATAIPTGMQSDDSFFRLVVDATPANENGPAMDFDDAFDDAITNVITLQAETMRLMAGVATPMAGPASPIPPAPPPPATVETAVAIVDLHATATAPDWPQVPVEPPARTQSEPSTASLSLADGLGESFAPARRGLSTRLGIAMAIAAGVLATIVGVGRSVGAAAPSAESWTKPAKSLAVTGREPGSAATIAGLAAPGPAAEMPAVMAALEARTIRALDGLFVTIPQAPAMRRAAATTHCRDLVIAGLTSWRLPTADEIALLGHAGFVPDDSIWWRGGKKVKKPRVEWTGKRVRQQSAKKTAAARTVCVHAVAL